jgi:hypothetical protein
MAAYSVRANLEEPAAHGFHSASPECSECHDTLIIRTDDYTCSEWCVSCQRSTIYAWTSCRQPALRLEARPIELTAQLTAQYRAQAQGG